MMASMPTFPRVRVSPFSLPMESASTRGWGKKGAAARGELENPVSMVPRTNWAGVP